MEFIQGKRCARLDATEFKARLNSYREVWVDIGTGDGRYTLHSALANPDVLVIGIDACRENLQQISRRSPANALFLIANAAALPTELTGLASCLTINFPWGSLLSGLLNSHSPLLSELQRIARPGAKLEIRLNRSALQKAGHSREAVALLVHQALRFAEFEVGALVQLGAVELRACPSTWAHRMAYGREPYALYLKAHKRKPQ
jgi:16S rRNA (adenine(1408)-N(1))-methyltransferase